MRKILLAAGLAAFAITSAAAQKTDKESPPNTIDCSAFMKDGGSWIVQGPTTVDIAGNNVTIGFDTINPHSHSLGGYDLYEVLERKCGGRK
jgi:hypothetical protein